MLCVLVPYCVVRVELFISRRVVFCCAVLCCVGVLSRRVCVVLCCVVLFLVVSKRVVLRHVVLWCLCVVFCRVVSRSLSDTLAYVNRRSRAERLQKHIRKNMIICASWLRQSVKNH